MFILTGQKTISAGIFDQICLNCYENKWLKVNFNWPDIVDILYFANILLFSLVDFKFHAYTFYIEFNKQSWVQTSNVLLIADYCSTYTVPEVISAEKHLPPLPFFLCDKSFSKSVNWTVIVYLHVFCLIFIK
jgi:hypothetical protein